MRINAQLKRPHRSDRPRGARMTTSWRSFGRRLRRDQQGATTLEWTMLLAVIGIPSYWIFKTLLATLLAHFHMMSTLNSLPFP